MHEACAVPPTDLRIDQTVQRSADTGSGAGCKSPGFASQWTSHLLSVALHPLLDAVSSFSSALAVLQTESYSSTFVKETKMARRITREEFESVFPTLVNVLLDHVKTYNMPRNAIEWFRENVETNTIGGKCNRGMSVPDSASILLGAPLDDKQFLHAAVLGWSTELLQAFFLVSDDIMDSSITRRDKPCWYRREGVGMVAINDAFMLESCVYVLLKTFFRSHPSYLGFMELFHETTLQTEIGQLNDLLTAPEVIDLDNFSMEKCSFIVIHKTAYYSFYLPVALALHLLNLATPKNLDQAKKILLSIGEYFQFQDDYLDNFGLPEHIGKIGTDIKDNKCSWLVNKALELVSPEQRKLLDENYGRKDDAKELAVKRLYDELKLKEHWEAYEEKRVSELRLMISQVDESEGLKRDVFTAFLDKIYKRSK
ncbi:hypothetical protein XA68_10447 [Ophiocordyceps unilateralis]|uniref:Farnesyl diphosphate synthase n=1 Tax=Ophiocordyceps unilateralis TaxID=268505 RepID=A0A2A9PH70_OPHUN|nr:hypothetical protein XA68_10447 [Ophiocordyceps unilateralis]